MTSKGGYNSKLAERHALRRAKTEVRILEAIAAHPGCIIPQIAQSVGLDANYISRGKDLQKFFDMDCK